MTNFTVCISSAPLSNLELVSLVSALAAGWAGWCLNYRLSLQKTCCSAAVPVWGPAWCLLPVQGRQARRLQQAGLTARQGAAVLRAAVSGRGRSLTIDRGLQVVAPLSAGLQWDARCEESLQLTPSLLCLRSFRSGATCLVQQNGHTKHQKWYMCNSNVEYNYRNFINCGLLFISDISSNWPSNINTVSAQSAVAWPGFMGTSDTKRSVVFKQDYNLENLCFIGSTVASFTIPKAAINPINTLNLVNPLFYIFWQLT